MDTLEHGSRNGKRRCEDGLTPFRRQVYAALCEVSAGRVTTYGRLAAAVGCRSARCVGGALRANPFAPRVPCHRVIAGDLLPGGFNGEAAGPAVARKLRLLEAEGVHFENGRLADPKRVHEFGGRAANRMMSDT